MIRKYHNHTQQTNPHYQEEEHQNNNNHKITIHQEDTQSKATSSLFPIKMIAKLERTKSNAQQKMEQTQNPTMGATHNSKLTTTEPLPKNSLQ